MISWLNINSFIFVVKPNARCIYYIIKMKFGFCTFQIQQYELWQNFERHYSIDVNGNVQKSSKISAALAFMDEIKRKQTEIPCSIFKRHKKHNSMSASWSILNFLAKGKLHFWFGITFGTRRTYMTGQRENQAPQKSKLVCKSPSHSQPGKPGQV